MDQGQNGLLRRGADGQPEARRRDPWVHWGRKHWGVVGWEPVPSMDTGLWER